MSMSPTARRMDPTTNLDTGQARVNNYHHPQRYLIPDAHSETGDGDEDEADDI